MTAVAGDINAATIDEAVNTFKDPDWLAKRRRAAWAAYVELPLPSSQRDEDWRRTDVGKLDPAQLELSHPSCAIGGDGSRLVVDDLQGAIASHPDIVQRVLSRVAPGSSKFIALCSAFARSGAFVYAPSGSADDEPVTITFDYAGGLGNAITLIVAERGARLNVVEVHNSSEPVVANTLTLIECAEDSDVQFSVVQSQHLEATHFSVHQAYVGKDARLAFFGLSTGAKLQKSYWNVALEGRGADARFHGAVAARGTQHLDHQSLQHHIAADTVSRLSLKAAVWEKAQSVYSGLIDVEHDAVHADGYVQNRNLILSDDARTNSVPRLEIKANDVKCGHGATAGHIDSDQRFYLESRGISRADADQMIVRGFFDDVFIDLHGDGARARLSEALETAISANDG